MVPYQHISRDKKEKGHIVRSVSPLGKVSGGQEGQIWSHYLPEPRERGRNTIATHFCGRLKAKAPTTRDHCVMAVVVVWQRVKVVELP